MDKTNSFLKTKEEITDWLDKYEIKNYTLLENPEYGYVVNVKNNVILGGKNLNFIPVKFHEVEGYFHCHNNQLTTLEFCPISVEGSFSITANKLTSLKGCPTTVGDFYCSDNQLTSLEFCPTQVVGAFDCSLNQLTSLEFSPTTIGSSFYCDNNQLTSLEFCPKTIGSNFYCQDNQLASLEFCPKTVGGHFYCQQNPALKGIQNIQDFSQILAFHKEILIKKEKDSLEKQLSLSEGSTTKTLFKM